MILLQHPQFNHGSCNKTMVLQMLKIDQKNMKNYYIFIGVKTFLKGTFTYH